MSAGISQVAALLKPASEDVFNGVGKLCLSVNYLHKLNCALEENYDNEDTTASVSFQTLQTSKSKTSLIMDVQFLNELVQQTSNLKIIPDVMNDCSTVNISKFKNLKILEVQKVPIQQIQGLQKLSSNLQQVTYLHCITHLEELLEKCGADNSQAYPWSELKKASFSHNQIVEIDDSFRLTPWLNTLDLSYNLLTNVDGLNVLHNLKYLNLSFNKLVHAPQFKGQLSSRLQILILKNNFIEEINGLNSLVNLVQLDLNQNSLLDHKCLLYISNLASLQYLNLQANPLCFHPQHRNYSCKFLNKNIASLNFVLDNKPLSKSEKSLAGIFHPMLPIRSSSSINSLTDYTPSVASERPRRVRNVTIEDDAIIKEKKLIVQSSNVATPHLEIKKQVEQLREEYGESWLNRRSGLLVQDVLGIDKVSPLYSSTPVSGIEQPSPYETALNISQEVKEDTLENVNFQTANDESPATVFDNNGSDADDSSDISEADDVDGEESIYFATIQGETDELLVVITETHISERLCTTSKERTRWHINSVLNCEIVEDSPNLIKLEFDTVRRNRKQRIYELDEEELLNFYKSIQSKGKGLSKPKENKFLQCMKCSEVFPHIKKNRILDEIVNCPKCDSKLVVEKV